MVQEFAVFSLAGSQFALGVSQVREVLRAASLSSSPGNRDVEGVFNLRGEVIPVVDLREQLDLPAAEIEATDFLIVFGDGSRAGAMRTEEPVQLESVDESCIEPSSECGLIVGAIQIQEKIVSLLSLEALLELID